MKIIANTKNGYLIDITKDEVGNLLGFYGEYQCNKKLNIGDSIFISKIYKHYVNIVNTIDNKEYNKAKQNIQALLEVLTPIQDLIDRDKNKLIISEDDN